MDPKTYFFPGGHISITDGKTKSYSQAAYQLGFAVKNACSDPLEVARVKESVQDSYTTWGHLVYNKAFLNWGLWDKKIYQDYCKLDFNFSTLCPTQDIYSQLLLYYLIRPLIQRNFFDKRLLDIGCGNGIGLKMSAQLLHTNYALGADLVNKLVYNATSHFYVKNQVSYIQADAEYLPFDDGSFDIIMNLESSHLYPQIECFFSEVARVLAPGGYFCYADIHINDKQQAKKLDDFVTSRKDLRIIKRHNLTKMVQASIYNRLIAKEKAFYSMAIARFGHDRETLLKELPSLAGAMGISFLPWWKIWVRTPELRPIAKAARKDTYWGQKLFFYYLIQKVGV